MLMVTLLAAALFGTTGCFASKPDTIIDYSAQPQNFILKLELNKSYLIKRNGEEFNFVVKTGFFDKDKLNIIWKKIAEERSLLRGSKRVPYLIYVDGRDYLYLYEAQNKAITYVNLNNERYLSLDNGMVKFYGEPTDPKRMLMGRPIANIGHCYAEEYYHVGAQGKPEPNEIAPEYHYVAQEYASRSVTLLENIEVEVFANANAQQGQRELLSKGTVLTRWRNQYADDAVVDLLLPDKRVARFYEIYRFSEPDEYIDINGYSAYELFDDVLK